MPVPHASVQYTSLKPASQPTTAVTGRHAVAGWPGIPQRLERKGFGRHAGAILDVLITFLPVMFFALAGCALYVNGKPQSRFGDGIIEASKFGPTVFPIVFAMVVAPFMKNIALWRVQQGTSLGLLEQLVGSQSVGSAIERFFLLRRFNIIGFAIVFLWALSPLGGQSSLRLISLANSTIGTSPELYYLNTSVVSTNLKGDGWFDSARQFIQSAYISALLAPQNYLDDPVDSWGHVKIPMLDDLSPWNDEVKENPWVPVHGTVEAPDAYTAYTAITGLPVAGLPEVGTTNFSMESMYWVCNCSDSSKSPSNGTVVVDLYGTQTALEPGVTLQPGSKGYFSSPGSASLFTGSTNDETETNPLYSNIFYISNMMEFFGNVVYSPGPSLWYYNCTVAVARVESSVSCEGTSCEVTSMRRSEKNTLPAWEPPPLMDYGTWSNMVTFLPDCGGNESLVLSPTDAFLTGQSILKSTRNSTFDDVSTAAFSKRLSVLLNTLWQIGLSPITTVNSNLIESQAMLTSSPQSYIEEVFAATSVTATSQTLVIIYETSNLWVSLLLALTAVVQIIAVAGLCFKFATIAPDILGYVSTMTRHNPFTDVPDGGNTLDGLHRARLLDGMTVQIADVHPENAQTGHIAFRSINSVAPATEGRLRKGRLYQ